MKSNRILAICILLIGVGFLNAQTTIYDANRWMGSDLNGTARFVGMGGAMGALGGDITTMGTNPAGIGIYRSNDFMVSLVLIIQEQKLMERVLTSFMVHSIMPDLCSLQK